jgi:hypothetical protein
LLGLLAIAGGAQAQVGPPRPGPRCLPGFYDGGQAELAAGLDLLPDRRFRYMLSYGVLDEVAEGQWESDGASAVWLTSDPAVAPRFSLEGEGEGTPGQIRLLLDVPAGISRQYFSAILRFADGRAVQRQFTEDGLVLELDGSGAPVSATLLLPVFSLESESFALSRGTGSEARFRFAPNDLGKVVFARTPLRIDREDLLLDRHERSIRFRRKGECEVSPR